MRPAWRRRLCAASVALRGRAGPSKTIGGGREVGCDRICDASLVTDVDDTTATVD